MVTVFTPASLGPLQLRNRIIKSATFEGMSPQGVASPALLKHHEALALGGVGMTTVAYCSVSDSGRTFEDQLTLCSASHPVLRELTETVNRAGAAASLQLGHCGFFTKLGSGTGPPLSPSRSFNAYGALKGLAFSKSMSKEAIAQVTGDFIHAAQTAVQLGFNAVELHLGHGYLLSQFLSPATNKRKDEYGGSIEGRMKLPIEIVQQVRDALPPSVAVLAKTNLDDGFKGGLHIEDSVRVAKALEAAGADGLVLSGGFTSRSAFYLLRGGRPLREMIQVEKSAIQRLALRIFGPLLVKKWPFEELFFLPLAKEVRKAVRMPLVLLGGAMSMANLETAMAEGFDFVAMGRALIADPDLVNRLQQGEVDRSRCNQCNQCIVEMDRGGVRCVLDD
jgi:2,4-dienoyl-CoA reductase-like NADH-dependent reductase (Old Yellow Enzyme family)